jgi:AraC-like DNA-binding protein
MDILSLYYPPKNQIMLTRESIFVILFSLPVYQLLFYTVQLISFKRRNPSKKYLGLLLFSMTTFLVINAVHFMGYYSAFSYLYVIYLPVLLSVAPAYFLYILSITRENHDVGKMQKLVIFIPAIILFLANLIVLGSMDQSTRLPIMQEGIFGYNADGAGNPDLLITFWIGGIILVFSQIIFISLKVSRIIQTETDVMRKEPAYLAYLEWRWILGISMSVLIFLVINIMNEMLVPINHIGMVIVYNVLMLFSGGVTGFFGMKQDALLNQVEKISFPSAASFNKMSGQKENTGNNKTQSDFITNSEAKEIHDRLISYLESEKPFIKSDYSMYDLCDNLNISRRKISYVLNEVMDKNFYGVINEYRVREAETLLMQDDMNQLKIEVLGEMVGFQSKSSFNACFKKYTGHTPSEYRSIKRVV